MIEKLKIKVLYNDFVNKVNLTDEQKRILNMMINKDSIVKMSMEIIWEEIQDMIHMDVA